MARNLADALAKILHFDQLFLLVVKENSKEIESAVLANGQLTLPDLPLEDLPSWKAFDGQDLLYVADWSTEERFPRFREWAKKVGRKLGSTVSVPLTTPHRRLGAFGITRETAGAYSEEDFCGSSTKRTFGAIAESDFLVRQEPIREIGRHFPQVRPFMMRGAAVRWNHQVGIASTCRE